MPAPTKYPPDVIAKVVRLRQEDRWSMPRIGLLFGMTKYQIRHIVEMYGAYAPTRTPTPFRRPRIKGPTSPRKCLKCKSSFPSEGAHNQICPPCSASNSNCNDRFELHYAVGGRVVLR